MKWKIWNKLKLLYFDLIQNAEIVNKIFKKREAIDLIGNQMIQTVAAA